VIGIVGMVAGLDFVEKETPVKLWSTNWPSATASAKSFWHGGLSLFGPANAKDRSAR